VDLVCGLSFNSLNRCAASVYWSSSGHCDHPHPLYRKQLVVSCPPRLLHQGQVLPQVYAQTRSFVVCWAGGSCALWSSLPPWYGEPKIEPDSCAYEQYSDLTEKNDVWMDVRTVHGCFLAADRTGFGLVPCLLPPVPAVVFCTTWVRTRPRLSHG